MVLVIEYGAGNVASVINSLQHLGCEYCVGFQTKFFQQCRSILLPGVGDGAYMMRRLWELDLVAPLQRWVKEGNPLLGICVGAQVLLTSTEEGNVGCLDIIKGTCKKFTPEKGQEKIPHMGWNSVDILQDKSKLFAGIAPSSDFYFVHSYYLNPEHEDECLAKTDYVCPFASVIGRDNVFGTQFHPEKSGKNGLQLLSNFLLHY